MVHLVTQDIQMLLAARLIFFVKGGAFTKHSRSGGADRSLLHRGRLRGLLLITGGGKYFMPAKEKATSENRNEILPSQVVLKGKVVE